MWVKVVALATSWRGTPADRFLPNFRRCSETRCTPGVPRVFRSAWPGPEAGARWGTRGTRNSKSPMDIDVPAFKRGGSRHFLRDPTAAPKWEREKRFTLRRITIEVHALIYYTRYKKIWGGRLLGASIARSSKPYRVHSYKKRSLYRWIMRQQSQ